jgi:PKD domain/Secretion system C-terminal sorting domain
MKMKLGTTLLCLLSLCGMGTIVAQPPVIYSEANINLVSPGVYQSYNCPSVQTDFWTDTTYASYAWSTGQTTSRISINGSGGPNINWSQQVNLSVTVTDAQGFSSTSSVVADSVRQPITVIIAPTTPEMVCAPDSVGLGMQFQIGEQLIWSNGHVCNTIFDCDASFLGVCVEYFLTSGSKYATRVFPGSGCQYFAGVVNVGVFATPSTPTITQSNDTLFATPGSPFYEWYDASLVMINGAIQHFYKPTAFGNYSVKANGSWNPSQVDCLSGISNPYNYASNLCGANYSWAADTSGQFSILVTNTCTPTPGNGGTYLWDFGDGNTSTQAYPQHQYAGPGNYNVCVTVSFSGCSQTYCDTIVVINKVSAPFTINVVDPNAIAVDPSMSDLQATVWPNPSQGQIQVDFQLSAAEQVRLRLLDLRGSVVVDGASRTIEAGTQRLSLDASAVAQGIYIAELWVGERAQHFKVVLQK